MKTYVAKRNFRSEEEAIKLISKYGVAEVLDIGDDHILENFVDFKYEKPSLNQMANLAKRIHSEKNFQNVPLVHGDFGEHNTTLLGGVAKCFDYEYSHFGNPYADVGRVILRSCENRKDVENFFREYSGNLPKLNFLKEGLIYFCDWQASLRQEKNAPYQEVPLIRKLRLIKTEENLEEILDAFKSEVKLK